MYAKERAELDAQRLALEENAIVFAEKLNITISAELALKWETVYAALVPFV
jgi:hypothetical protein